MLNAEVYFFQQLWQQIELCDPWDQVLVTNNGFESIDGLECDGLVLTNKVYSGVEEQNSILERTWLFLVHNINKVSKK